MEIFLHFSPYAFEHLHLIQRTIETNGSFDMSNNYHGGID